MRNILKLLAGLSLVVTFLMVQSCGTTAEHKALIITGQNNHNWEKSSAYIKTILDQTGIFETEVLLSPPQGEDMSGFLPDFSNFEVVVLDYNGDPWPEKAKSDFVEYVKNGGGVVIYHAADNAFPEWKEYNEMIGLGRMGEP